MYTEMQKVKNNQEKASVVVTPVILALGRLKQEGNKCEARLIFECSEFLLQKEKRKKKKEEE
jgi:hypothetical protein